MDKTIEQFLELLRAGLWRKSADTEVFDDDTDWNAILEIAKAQTVIALVFDGMETLPSELRPPRKLFLEWFTLVVRIEKSNESMERTIVETFHILRDNGINPILLKGHGMAANYLKPNHRQCGDIDIYTGEKDYENANSILGRKFVEVSKTQKHTSFEVSGMYVENHVYTQTFENSTIDKYYKLLETKYLCTDNCCIVIDDKNITIPPPEFNIVFTLAHITRHLMRGGIGIRQICDFTMLLHRTQEADREEICNMLNCLKMSRIAGAIGGIAVKCLGLPEEELPFAMEKKNDSSKILAEILCTGNFGFYDKRVRPEKKNFVSRKLQTSVTFTKKMLRVGRYYPAQLYGRTSALIKKNLKNGGKR